MAVQKHPNTGLPPQRDLFRPDYEQLELFGEHRNRAYVKKMVKESGMLADTGLISQSTSAGKMTVHNHGMAFFANAKGLGIDYDPIEKKSSYDMSTRRGRDTYRKDGGALVGALMQAGYLSKKDGVSPNLVDFVSNAERDSAKYGARLLRILDAYAKTGQGSPTQHNLNL